MARATLARIRDRGGTGFWHETYFRGGQIKSVYIDMPGTGLAKFAPVTPARGSPLSAARRHPEVFEATGRGRRIADVAGPAYYVSPDPRLLRRRGSAFVQVPGSCPAPCVVRNVCGHTGFEPVISSVSGLLGERAHVRKARLRCRCCPEVTVLVFGRPRHRARGGRDL